MRDIYDVIHDLDKICPVDDHGTAMIYFLGVQGERSPLKIGFTGSPAGRLRQMQTAHWQTLKFLALAACEDNEFEKFLHWQLQEVKLRGEWYDVDVGELMVVCMADWGVDFYDDEEPEFHMILDGTLRLDATA